MVEGTGGPPKVIQKYLKSKKKRSYKERKGGGEGFSDAKTEHLRRGQVAVNKERGGPENKGRMGENWT